MEDSTKDEVRRVCGEVCEVCEEVQTLIDVCCRNSTPLHIHNVHIFFPICRGCHNSVDCEGDTYF